LSPAGRLTPDFLQKSGIAKAILKIVGISGISMMMAGSVLAPAQSVLSVAQGVHVVRLDPSRPAIVSITCGMLILFFMLQPLGTSKPARFLSHRLDS
jgi:KUP system potassium uptake protein